MNAPLIITPRLMAGAQIGESFLSIEIERYNAEGRACYAVFLDLPDGTEHVITNLRSGCGGGSEKEGLVSLLSFLLAAVEGRKYQEGTGRVSETAGLFMPAVLQWAIDHKYFLEALQYDLED
ncbi:MAG: hypothetical protein DDT20_00839 [Firmicutes bacterium]|nr:hypothetical protein [Bacillota bacterium]